MIAARRRQPSPDRAPARLRASWPVLAALVLVLVAMTVVVTGCGEEEPEAQGSLAEEISAAEQNAEDAADPQNPSEFISLCANCHDRLDKELDWRKERKLVFNHSVHFANGIRCVACHQEFPHKPGKTEHVSVETCFQCHGQIHGEQGSLAPTDCDACHTPDIATITPEHERSDWLLASGEKKAMHSQQGAERRLYCRMCHADSFCSDCHQVEMPHPEKWTEEGHQPVVETDRESCAQCHPEKNFCNDCHHSSLPKVADWGEQHNKVATQEGPASSCYTCHQPPFCSECHVEVGKERGTLGE